MIWEIAKFSFQSRTELTKLETKTLNWFLIQTKALSTCNWMRLFVKHENGKRGGRRRRDGLLGPVAGIEQAFVSGSWERVSPDPLLWSSASSQRYSPSLCLSLSLSSFLVSLSLFTSAVLYSDKLASMKAKLRKKKKNRGQRRMNAIIIKEGF